MVLVPKQVAGFGPQDENLQDTQLKTHNSSLQTLAGTYKRETLLKGACIGMEVEA